MNPTDFESRARGAARTRIAELQRDKPIAFYEDCYVHAAQWARKETIDELKKAGLWAAVDYLERERNREGQIYEPLRL